MYYPQKQTTIYSLNYVKLRFLTLFIYVYVQKNSRY